MKIRISLLVVAALAVWALDFATAQNKPDTGASKILVLENKWNAAMREGISQPWILCWPMISSSPSRTEAHSANLDISHNGDSTVHVEISAMSDLRVRMHGNTAVVTGRYREKGRSKDKPYEYRDRFTDVWMKINGRWQVIASHYSVPASQ
jgi:hypothetical protein